MNRRDFHKSLGALSVLPLLPGAAAAAPVSGTQMAWAKAISQAQGSRAPVIIGRFLKVDFATAQRLCVQVRPATTALKSWGGAMRATPLRARLAKMRNCLEHLSQEDPEQSEA